MSGSSVVKQMAVVKLAADIKTRDQMLYYAPVAIIVQILCRARCIVQKIPAFIKVNRERPLREIEDSEVKSSKIRGWRAPSGRVVQPERQPHSTS